MSEKASHWLDLLDQDQIWTDAQGRTHRLADMDLAHCRNVRDFLVRHATWIFGRFYIATADQARSAESQDEANALLTALEEQEGDPVGWLLSKPLLRALDERIGPIDLRPGKTRTVTVVARLAVEKTTGIDTVRRSLEKALRGMPYDHDIVSVNE